jgi:hypothetical protein
MSSPERLVRDRETKDGEDCGEKPVVEGGRAIIGGQAVRGLLDGLR